MGGEPLFEVKTGIFRMSTSEIKPFSNLKLNHVRSVLVEEKTVVVGEIVVTVGKCEKLLPLAVLERNSFKPLMRFLTKLA